MERLAGISLQNPQKVAINASSVDIQNNSVKQASHKNSKASEERKQQSSDALETTETESFALPESLNQYFVITPCKLRLVVLLTLVMTKCKVGYTIHVY